MNRARSRTSSPARANKTRSNAIHSKAKKYQANRNRDNVSPVKGKRTSGQTSRPPTVDAHAPKTSRVGKRETSSATNPAMQPRSATEKTSAESKGRQAP